METRVEITPLACCFWSEPANDGMTWLTDVRRRRRALSVFLVWMSTTAVVVYFPSFWRDKTSPPPSGSTTQTDFKQFFKGFLQIFFANEFNPTRCFSLFVQQIVLNIYLWLLHRAVNVSFLRSLKFFCEWLKCPHCLVAGWAQLIAAALYGPSLVFSRQFVMAQSSQIGNACSFSP